MSEDKTEAQRVRRLLSAALDSPGVTIRDGDLSMRAGNRILNSALVAKLAKHRENQP